MERKWGVTYQARDYQLQQNCEFVLGLDLALMLRRGAHRLVSMLKRGDHELVELQRLAFFMLKRDPEIRVLNSSTTIAFGTERDPHAVLLMKYDVRV